MAKPEFVRSFLGAALLGAAAGALCAEPPETAAAGGGTDGPDASQTALPPVVVEGSRGATVAAAGQGDGGIDFLSATAPARTPLALTRIDAEDLVARGVASLSSAIRVDPSVGDNYNTFGYIEALQVRGFVLNELLNYQRDGMTVSSHVPVALEDKERIEILKGISGMLAVMPSRW